MGKERREELIQEILGLEPALLRARFSVQPPPWLDIDVTMLQLKTLLGLFSAPRVRWMLQTFGLRDVEILEGGQIGRASCRERV